MNHQEYCDYLVRLSRDRATKQVVAEVPALKIADYGPDSQKALQRLTRMVAFHLECLVAEGKPVPNEPRSGEGVYIRVKRPASAP